MHINYLAVLAAGLANFIVGGLWYSPVMFVKTWKAELGVGPDAPAKPRSMAVMLAGTFVLGLVQAGRFAVFLGQQPPLMGAAYGLAAGVCWVATAFAINYMYAGRSLKLFLIDGGFNVVVFTLYGLILGLWH